MPWFSSMPDRRTFPRFRAEIPLIVSLVGDKHIASLRTLAGGISEGGLSLSSLPGVAVGETVSLQIHLPTGREALWLNAIVRHNAAHCGLEFSYVSPEQRKLIDHYCRLQPYEKG
jgi:c-di-GMP-binding flagellar brake protein YcgR